MAEGAWLDNLSEDWNSEPRSSSSLPLPTGSSPSSQRSRIPRYSGSHSSLARSALQRRHSSSHNTGRRTALAERRSSDINVPARPLPHPKSASQKSLDSSQASVLHNAGSVVQHPKPLTPKSSPQKPAHTPEWKRLVLGDQECPTSQRDLFAPIGLEGIFQRPRSSSESSHEPNALFSFMRDSDAMPSSPPPWPAGHRGSKFTFANSHDRSAISELDAVEEQDESAVESYADSSAVQHPQSGPGNGHGNADLSRPEQSSLGPETSMLSSQAQSSATSNDFSPVYISKHATVDGIVNYAAVDLSNPEHLEQLKQLSQQTHRDDADDAAPQELRTSSVVPRQVSQASTALPPLSDFVNVARGGTAEQGSFRQRPLSPSQTSSAVPSDSLLPEDSASQVHVSNTPNERLSEQTPSVSTSTMPRTPSPTIVQPKSNMKASPLKLFTDHDAWSNDNFIQRAQRVESAEIDRDAISHQPSVDHAQPFQNISANSDISLENPAALSPRLARLKTEEKADSRDSLESDRDQLPLSTEHTRGDVSPNKRNAPMPFKQSTPKRQRGSGEQRDLPESTHAQNSSHRLSTVIGQKRKDAKYDSASTIGDPASIARRQILRPRNPTPGAGKSRLDASTLSDMSEAAPRFQLDAVADMDTTGMSEIDAAQMRAVVAEAASMRVHGPEIISRDTRKPSISTQDYVNEAMRIFQFIRSNRQPEWDFSSIAEEPAAESSPIQSTLHDSLVPERLSRPPSREGHTNVWRSQAVQQFEPDVLHHLKKFQETGDDFYLASSLARSVASRGKFSHPSTRKTRDVSDPPNIRILASQSQRRHSDSFLPDGEMHPFRSQEDTDVVTHSTDNSAHTTSSQRARIAVIAPEKVSHLIAAQQIQSGMRFDSEKLTWVKCKKNRDILGEHASSSTGSEDDPLGQIPDLHVDQMDEDQRRQMLMSQQETEGDDFSGLQVTDLFHTDPFDLEDDSLADSLLSSSPVSENQNALLLQIDGQNAGEKPADDRPVGNQESATEQHRESSTPVDEIDRDRFGSSDRVSRTPVASVNRRRREQSVMFSSPPVSHQRTFEQWSDGPESNDDPKAYVRNFLRPVPDNRVETEEEVEDIPIPNGLEQQRRIHNIANTERALSLSRLEDNFEVSLVSTRPDGRAMSLTWSMSTPLAANGRIIGSGQVSRGRSNGLFMRNLSPLSEFTVHQDDRRHLASRNLLRPRGDVSSRQVSHETAVSHTRLVEKLTHAEPEEPYWDWIKSLDLQGHELDHLDLLDEFCPRIEDLNLSHNRLRHIEGAPTTLRNLRIEHNALTSLTDWTNYSNIQYLDVSHNEIDNLTSFSGLVHLRELKADNNVINDIEGIFDLDGLLKLSLRCNRLKHVNFSGSSLRRLSHLDLAENEIASVSGLEDLSELTELDLERNEIRCMGVEPFDGHGGGCNSLKELCINLNKLETLDVSSFPLLTNLFADGNALNTVRGAASHKTLEVVSMRDQSISQPAIDSSEAHAFDFEAFHNVRELYLSGTPLQNGLATSKPFLSLQTLDVSFTGLQKLPGDFANTAPNLRVLNLNTNSIKDIRALAGIRRLSRLYVAGNRLGRLRRLVKTLQTFDELTELDCRGNPVCVGLYPALSTSTSKEIARALQSSSSSASSVRDCSPLHLSHVLPPADLDVDVRHLERLDEETGMRRRVYELLLATKCPSLQTVDGLSFDRARVERKDHLWERLVELGVVQPRSSKEC